jgi:bacteriophage CI repressor helix-turn-helix domain
MLQELLEKNQITQQALAEKLNVSQQAVSKWNKRISTPIKAKMVIKQKGKFYLFNEKAASWNRTILE